MPPKKTSKKLTKGEESANEEHTSSEEEQPKKTQKVAVVKSKKEELKAQTKSKPAVKDEKWDEQSQEGSEHVQNEQCNDVNQSDHDNEPEHVEQKDTREKPQRGARYQSSALKFKYEDFELTNYQFHPPIKAEISV